MSDLVRHAMLAGVLVCLCACRKPMPQTTVPVSFADLTDFQQQPATASEFCVQPGLLAIGNYALPEKVGGCVTFAGGSGDAKVYVDEDGQLITAATTGITNSAVTAQMTFQNVSTPEFPDTAVPVCDLTVTNGTYTVDACGLASRVRLGVLGVGAGLKRSVVAGKARIELDPAQVCLLFGSCNVTGTINAAGGSLVLPRGAGPPPAAACNAESVAGKYIDTNAGGLEYFCAHKADGSYAWTAAGASAPPEPQPATLTLWFPAAVIRADGVAQMGSGWWSLPSTNGGAVIGSYTAGTHARAYLLFNSGVSTTAQFNYLLPANWAPPLAVRIAWQSGDLAAAKSLFDLRVSTQCWKPNTRYGASLAWGTEQSSTDGITGLNVDTDEDWQIAKVDSLLMTNCAAGDVLAIQFRRNASDSLTKEARIFGVELLVGVKQ